MTLLATLVLFLGLIHHIKPELDTSAFKLQVENLAKGILGTEKYQDYLDTDVVYSPTIDNPEQVLDKLSGELYSKINQRIEAVSAIRDKVQSEFSKFAGTATYQDCCFCCEDTGDEEILMKFRTQVDLEGLCHTGQGTGANSGQAYPNTAVLEVMKKNLEDNPVLKWQYFGGEDGIMSIYPGNNACDSNFDPRYRPWYSYTAFPTPKDVVIVLDRSGSMSSFYKDRQLMEIAQEAATTVIDTLNPDDRFAVVFFSDDAETKCCSCYDSKLAMATPENKEKLGEYVKEETASGGTYYGRAFTRAFQYFKDDDPAYDHRQRVRVILFLTDGQPTDKDYLDEIAAANSEKGNSVVILTFGFGDGIGDTESDILTEIAEQINFDPSAGNVTQGRFVHVLNPDNLRYNMATYYDFFSQKVVNTDVTVSLPYLDAFGLGLITSICLPIHVSNMFRGVTCIDVTLSDLFSEATYFSRGLESYAFIVDEQTRLLVHPLLPRPSDVYDDPVSLRVLDLEVEPIMKTIVENYLLMGVPGNETFSSRRVFSRGDSEHDGVDTIKISSMYIWRPIGVGGLTLCVVLGNADTLSKPTSVTQIASFPYHRLDITAPQGRCRYLNRLAVTDTSTIKFASFAFLSPDYYLELKETSKIVETYETFFTGSSNEGLFQLGTKAAVAVSTKFDDVISKSDTAWQEAVWRYLGLREGVFRLFPGAKLVPKYDHTVRSWYERAQSQREKITFSRPYVDAFGAGVIITLSKAIFESRISGVHSANDFTAGVMGMDFTMELFNSILIQYVQDCNDKQCFIIDNSGYIIFHPTFEKVQEKDIEQIEYLHITQKEPYIANQLITQNVLRRDACFNFKKRQIQSFYRVTRQAYTGSKFDLKEVQGTNVFIIYKTETNNEADWCHCPVSYGAEIPACDDYTCECPCYDRKSSLFDQCSATFVVDPEIGALPPCTPPVPAVDLASVATEEKEVIQDLAYCYPVEQVCPERKKQLNCSATAGCKWCGSECGVRGDEGCDGLSGSSKIVAIVVPVVLIALVIILVIILVMLKGKRVICHKGNPPPTTEPRGTDNLGMVHNPSVDNVHNSARSPAYEDVRYGGSKSGPPPTFEAAPPAYEDSFPAYGQV